MPKPRITPMVQQSIKLLELSKMDLIEWIRKAMAENPLLAEDLQFDFPSNIPLFCDLVVKKVGGEYRVDLNQDGIPKLLIRERMAADEKDNGYRQQAQCLIKSIKRRQKILCQVAQSMVEFQRDFLNHGPKHVTAMTLKQIAEKAGRHISTISRVTRDKFILTPYGVLELRSFFNHGSHSEKVKATIKGLIDLEDGDNPLSDLQITELLIKQGIPISRRTVTKYRESLGIAPFRQRSCYRCQR